MAGWSIRRGLFVAPFAPPILDGTAQKILSFPHPLCAVGQLSCCDGVGLSELPDGWILYSLDQIRLWSGGRHLTQQDFPSARKRRVGMA
jgi:hypothetical protein|uniref:Uncharacterized protein n=2 Tax=Picea TaxID=3328 RepID=A0A117NGX3_PICGL|nr:hypothetical protein ABT39_MTgene5651 [Picea glauca]QHR90258.1 hypothetical protein Q903MT_gene4281 [Picea sitchensis]